ncbi:MMPL family transporter [Paludifilum halophilum]|uniref:MMPL domain-containing protein n=1 Tax=Paludifilum halophilum TaxID=1642702 RepID=A0A235B3E0_9BACL|nr:MMPL family transporter [Paludifilum halophilum]OYD06828.1 MMPL domain-containing protein [Paludifilum halophilum]
MKILLQAITDRIATKKGMWMTLAIWLVVTVLLAVFAPSAKDYEVTRIDSLPEDAQSVIAQKKVDQYFKEGDGTPAILVFQSTEGKIAFKDLENVLKQIENENIEGMEPVVSLSSLPPEAAAGFFSDDQTTALIPLSFHPSLENQEIKHATEQLLAVVEGSSNLNLYVTGPAGIATDSLELFSRADFVLIASTIILILVLLMVIYRSPLLAFIPLLAAAFVYEGVMQLLGIMGSAGLALSRQTISIMSILLFAAVIDYSLFIFSRYREELKEYEDKFESMKRAMRETGMPVFFSGGTVLAAMLVLFIAQSGDYRNFAPTFAVTMAVIMLASMTLVPALFILFGRKSFWPKVPKVGDAKVKTNSFWNKVGRIVVERPGMSVAAISLILLASASNVFNMQYEFDTMQSFPEDMPSRQGYQILGDQFAKGDLAPSTILLESSKTVTKEEQESLRKELAEQPLVSNVRINGTAENNRVINYRLTFEASPYALETINAMEDMIHHAEPIVDSSDVEGKLYFAGETAAQVDDRSINNQDTVVIVLFETLLIFGMLMVLTRSFKLPVYMMGTILVSFFAALGLGMFLTQLLFDIDTISNRVPLYSFVFLVALGIDYNIMFISRFQEERKKHSIKKSVERAVANTGGVISSAGVILAATFAVLMTQPIQLLFVFGFIVAVGILLDTFLIRGVLLPGLLVLLEKDQVNHKPFSWSRD